MKEAVLCGQCQMKFQEVYKLVQLGRREKVTCEGCGKRRYGGRVTIEGKNRKEGQK